MKTKLCLTNDEATTCLWRIELSYACFGIITNSDNVEYARVVEAPPIARWMKGRRILDVIHWVRERGRRGKIEIVY